MERDKLTKWLSFTLATVVTVAIVFSINFYNKKHKTNYMTNNKTQIASDSNVEGLKDGEYEGISQGYGGDFKVKIKIKNGELSAINVVTNNETPEYYEKASVIIAQILEKGNTDVDSISGATISSEAIKNAVRDALHKAGSKNKTPKLAQKTQKPTTPNVATKGLKDGVYEASSNGYGGRLTVRVTVKNGKLANIDVISHNETPSYFRRASSVIDRILSTGSVNVDSVAGATISSNAIKQAVSKALAQAGSKEKAKISRVNPNAKSGKKSIRNLVGKISIGNKQIKDGQYIGIAQGFNGPIKVRVTVKEGSIAKIEILSHNDDNPYFQRASRVISKILGKPGKKVDTISQATYSSRGIINAVNNALSKAGVAPNASKGKKAENPRQNNKKPQNKPGNNSSTNNPGKINDAKLKDGQFTGMAQGFNGPITVRVTISNGSITNVEILSHSDDGPYFARAMAVVSRILGKPGKTVDTVSQATYSSRGIINAVNNALSKAGAAPNISKGKKAENPGQNNQNPQNNPGNNSNANSSGRINDAKLKDGQFTGIAQGFNGPITVRVTVSNGSITNVEILSHSDDGPYFARAMAVVSRILGKPGKTVDTVSQATYSSRGIINAVNNALSKAGVAPNISNENKPENPRQNNKEEGEENNKKPQNNPEDNSKPNSSGKINDAKIKDGQFTGIAQGFSGPITVRVTITNGLISGVEIVSHSDDAPYFAKAMAVISRILGKPGKTVDTVSEATYSSRGIINAVNNALSKAKSSPNESDQKPENKPEKENPDKKNPEKKNPEKEKPDKDKNEPEKIDDALKKYYNDNPLRDGEYSGWGIGYINTRKTKTYIKVENGEIIDIKVGKDSEYGDDMGPFREKAEKVLSFLKGKKGRLNLAKMGLYREYFEQIRNSRDPKSKVEELFGKQYGALLNGLSGNNIKTESDLTLISRAVKAYMSDKYKSKEMFDSITGATVSASGIAQSTREATAKSSNDYKNNSNVKEIKIISPKNKTIEVNKNDRADFSEMEIIVIKKDGSAEKVGWADFQSNGISITDDKGNIITSDLSKYSNTNVIKARVVHKKSLSYDEFRILIGNYSKDYIVALEYSVDGNKWYRLETASKDSENTNNISDRQIIDAPKSFEYKNVKIRAVSKNNNRYYYTTTDPAINNLQANYDLVSKGNPNLPTRIFVTFKLSGNESDKKLVKDKEKENEQKEKEKPQGKEEVKVDQKVIDTSLMESNGQQWLEGRAIKPATVTSLDPEAKIVAEIEGLPKGLTFDGKTISGTPEISDEGWPENGVKTITLKLKAEKGDKLLVRTITYWLYRDKDRDGLADADEGDKGEKFTPQRANSQAIIVNGKAPSLEDYKAKFSNIPKDGSVEVSFKKEPDYSKVSEAPQRVYLQFKAKNAKEVGEAYVMIVVKKAAEKEKPQGKEEVEVSQKVIDTSLMESNGQQWLEGRAIKPATVTSLDPEAKIVAEIEGLPKGLTFDGKTISGTPEISDEGWPENGVKTITLKLKAEKGDKLLVRTITYWLYRDKDRDGLADADEGDKGEKFTPQRANSQPIIVNGTKPTIDEYKSKFSNIPQDGSVEVTLEKEPDYTKVGQFRVNLIFKLRSTNEISTSYVFIKIVKPVVDDKKQEKENPEKKNTEKKNLEKKNPEKENPKKENPKKENSEKQPDKNTIDKKSEKSQPKNEKTTTKTPNSDQSNRVELKSVEKTNGKTNGKTDSNIDTKKQDEKQKNLENLKEEIR
ncbi:FMN-binding protein [Finegoldia magna]|uniref:FMN-binding protein n=1 Tax=Finegoldia magna TaxID=1260 RepID=UPI0012AF9DA3|nr:FMN-binding protein [Finegoldia magna]MSB16577.1 FMN-binding protein [Finegoldia magna]MSD45364.1 FMN-binding protein [Finegoldia magna]